MQRTLKARLHNESQGEWACKLLSANSPSKQMFLCNISASLHRPCKKEAPGSFFRGSRAGDWQRPTFAHPFDALSSGLQRFTSVFGMGTGGATALGSPEGRGRGLKTRNANCGTRNGLPALSLGTSWVVGQSGKEHTRRADGGISFRVPHSEFRVGPRFSDVYIQVQV